MSTHAQKVTKLMKELAHEMVLVQKNELSDMASDLRSSVPSLEAQSISPLDQEYAYNLKLMAKVLLATEKVKS